MITIQWDNPAKSIIRLDYPPKIASWQAYREAVMQSFDMANSVQHPCSIIHYGPHTAMPDGGAKDAFDQIRWLVKQAPNNVHHVISVNRIGVARRVVQIAAKIILPPTHLQLHPVTSLDEAYAIANQRSMR